MPVIDDFNDGDMAEWSGGSTVTSPVYEGSHAGRFNEDGGARSAVGPPVQFEFYFYVDSGQQGGYMHIGNSPLGDLGDYHQVFFDATNNKFDVKYFSGGNQQEGDTGNSVNIPKDQWVQCLIEWETRGRNEFRATINGTSGWVDSGTSSSDISFESIGPFSNVKIDYINEIIPAPSDPSNLTANASGDDITLDWDDNSNNEDGFRIYRSQSPSSGFSAIATTGAPPYTDTALLDGERYYYYVVAYNSSGESGATNTAGATTALPDPSGVSQVVQGDDSISVDVTDGSDNADEFLLQVSEDGGGYSTVGTYAAGSYPVTYSATPSTNSHRFRARAETEHTTSGYTYSSTVDTDPTGLSVTATTETTVDLSWSGVQDASGYEVLIAETSGSTAADYSSATTTSGSTTATVSGLENGERYYFRVRATYSGTDSQPTNEVDTTTALPGPTNISLTPQS